MFYYLIVNNKNKSNKIFKHIQTMPVLKEKGHSTDNLQSL